MASSATISIITPTWKGISAETRRFVASCPVEYEWLTERGVGGAPLARNNMALRAKYPLLMFLDEDAWLDAWCFLMSENEFFMDVHNHTQPQGRCFIVRKYDFFKVGGFDASLRYSADDVDIACRLMDMGLAWRKLLGVRHNDHARHFHRNTALNECKVVMRHHKKHPEFTRYILEYQWEKIHPLKWAIQLAGYGYYGLSRSL